MKPAKCLHSLSISILGHAWSVFYWPGIEYKALHGSESRAVTLTRPKQIHFNCSSCYEKDNVAVHELTHAYAAELMFHDLPALWESHEEFFCVLMETRGAEILAAARPLTKLLHKHARTCREEVNDDAED